MKFWLYVAEESGSIETANRLIDSIVDRFFLLATHPYMGRRRDHDLRGGLRSMPAGGYVIIYKIDNSIVSILRVFHGRRDIAALIGD